MAEQTFEDLFSGAYRRAKATGVTKFAEARDSLPLLKAEAAAKLVSWFSLKWRRSVFR